MRLRSGVFASFCLLVQALGVGLFLRGFFPVAVRSQLRSGTFGQVPPEPPQTGTASLLRSCVSLGSRQERCGRGCPEEIGRPLFKVGWKKNRFSLLSMAYRPPTHTPAACQARQRASEILQSLCLTCLTSLCGCLAEGRSSIPASSSRFACHQAQG